MRWTKNPPTKPGWYWWKLLPSEPPEIRTIVENTLRDNSLYVVGPSCRPIPLTDYMGLWSDEPIPQPEGM